MEVVARIDNRGNLEVRRELNGEIDFIKQRCKNQNGPCGIMCPFFVPLNDKKTILILCQVSNKSIEYTVEAAHE